MPRKKLSLEQGKKLIEDTKRRLRLEQEARTRERLEQIEFERFDRLEWQYCFEMKEGKSKNSSLFAFSQIPSLLLIVNDSNLTLSIFVD